ncbi:MAG: hypothetical protein HQK87_10190, partial [Nitrospinae bacterium]|nr:hypothetical protein [Nitrospinota bacterium]
MKSAKPILKALAWGLAFAVACWLGFFLIFVHPNPARVDDPLAELDGAKPFDAPRRAVAIDLIDRLPSALVMIPRLSEGRRALAAVEAITDYPYAPADAPVGIPVSVTQGKHAMLLEQRNALYLPTDGIVAFDVAIPAGGRLSYGLSILSRLDGKESAPVTFSVTVDEGDAITVIDAQTLKPEPLYPHSETEFWYHTVGKFLSIDADY